MKLVPVALFAACLMSMAPSKAGAAVQVVDLERDDASRLNPAEFTASTRFRKHGREYTLEELKARQEKFMADVDAMTKRFQNESTTRLAVRQQLYAPQKRVIPLFSKQRSLPVSPSPASAIPVIASLNAKALSPGGYIIISGGGFGDHKGAVVAVIADKIVDLAITDWGPTSVYAQLPGDIQGVLPVDGLIKVKTSAGAFSSPVQFHFEPATEVVLLDQRGWGERQVKKGGTAYVTCVDYDQVVGATHYGAPVYGCSGTDRFFMHVTLKNGWVVDKIDFTPVVSEMGEAECKIAEGREGSISPEVAVSWWNSAMDACGYTLAVYVRGPRGTNYR